MSSESDSSDHRRRNTRTSKKSQKSRRRSREHSRTSSGHPRSNRSHRRSRSRSSGHCSGNSPSPSLRSGHRTPGRRSHHSPSPSRRSGHRTPGRRSHRSTSSPSPQPSPLRKVSDWLDEPSGGSGGRQSKRVKEPRSPILKPLPKPTTLRDGLVSIKVNEGKANFPLCYPKGKPILKI